MIGTALDDVFHRLYGQPCWNAKSGYGSFMTMEFGRPSLKIRDPRMPCLSETPALAKYSVRRIVTVRGQWHLWIHSCEWQVMTGKTRIGHSNPKGSSKRPIKRAAEELDGQKLQRTSFDAQSGKTVFEFDLGGRLETLPYNQTSDQWLLYEPSGYVVALRGDGHYSHQPGDTPPEEQVYQPLLPLVEMESGS